MLPRSLIVTLLVLGPLFGADTFPKPKNTQNPKDIPPTAQEAARKITVPEGFRVTLFAGDPDVRQPIAMCTDDRGRLWVAESYTYSGKGGGAAWDKGHRDRVLIFEDTDNDGSFDKRIVFFDQAQNLSGITIGFGGVWLLCAPRMLFLPDRDGDDKPDGDAEVKLDGWAVEGVGHNIVNGMTWGPDGWLYGRHGIMATSLVGTPETPPEKRVRLNCSIWRYHPTRRKFEVVTHGTTNPWGFDYDDRGEMFFTNNVIGHLWHIVPGAHYKRMYGEDFNPRTYALIDQHADHYHWDTGKNWTDSRDAKGVHGELGGGHSHCGGMIYLGDNWPDAYRNNMFMCNTHGRRVNRDRLVREGSGYEGKHEKDFLFANNPWFRGIDLKYGPDGGVYLSDWTDIGECHDHDGVHRTSGRIYKVVYKDAKSSKIADVSKLPNAQLVELQLHRNDWFVRKARRILLERASAGKDMKRVHAELRKMYATHEDITRVLRAMWALYVTGGTDAAWLREQLDHADEHVRAWAVRLLVDGDGPIPADTVAALRDRARGESSGLVRLYLASGMQRLKIDERFSIAWELVGHPEDAEDHNLPLMLWYGIEPLVGTRPKLAGRLAFNCEIPLVRQFIARRLTEDIESDPSGIDALLSIAMIQDNPRFDKDILLGMSQALRGWRKAKAPSQWSDVSRLLVKNGDETTKKLLRDLGVVFGDGRALHELRKVAMDGKASGIARRDAIRLLVRTRDKNIATMLRKLIGDRATAAEAARGLVALNDSDAPKLVVQRFRFFRGSDRDDVVGALASRPNYAKVLLDAVASGKIPREAISAFHARQIASLNDEELSKQLAKVWGEVRSTPAEKKKLIEKYRALLTDEKLKSADLSQGRVVFNESCANCHKLYGQGKEVGPDLTGSNRDNLTYLLENMIDPSAVVPVDFKMSVVRLASGQVLTGVLLQSNDKTVTLQGQKEQSVLVKSDIESIESTSLSLMPDGQIEAMSEDKLRNLIAYLKARRQVPLPPSK